MGKLEPLAFQNVHIFDIFQILLCKREVRENHHHISNQPPSPAGNGAANTKGVLALKSHSRSKVVISPKPVSA